MVKNTTYLHQQTLSQSLETCAQQSSRTPFSISVPKFQTVHCLEIRTSK